MGKIFTITGSSATGKTSIAKHFFTPKTTIISYTSRQPREGEKNGVDYYFVSKEKMKEMKENDEFLEFINFNNTYYGYTYQEIEEKTKNGDAVAVITYDGLIEFLSNEKTKNKVKPIFLYATIEKVLSNLETRTDDVKEKEKRIKLYEVETKNNMKLAKKLNAPIIDTSTFKTLDELYDAFEKFLEEDNNQ